MSRSNSKTRTRRTISGQHRAAGIALLLTVAFVLWSIPWTVSADEGGFTTDSYKVNIETKANHEVLVSEEIQVNFSAPRHGLYRYIPDGGKYYSVRDIEVDGFMYDTYEESGNQVVQIGDPDVTVSGVQTYRIHYRVVGYRDDDETKDMLSLDLLPTGWSTPIQYAEVTLMLPRPVEDMKFYSGAYGEKEEGNACFNIGTDGMKVHAVSRNVLPKGVGLTVKADLPEGYWVNPASRDDSLPAMYGALGVLGMLMLLLWLFVGRDNPIIQTVEFYPPEGMDPLEAAYIGNDRVVPRDLAALFMYLANKGYVTITSNGKKNFRMSKAAEIGGNETGYTRQVFRALFSGGRSEVTLKCLPESFGETAAKINGEVKDVCSGKRRNFSAVSKVGRVAGLFCCLLIPFLAGCFYFYLTFGFFAGLCVTALCPLVILISMWSLVSKTDAFRTKKKPVRIVISLLIMLAAVLLEASVIVRDYPVLAAVFTVSVLAAAVATIFVRKRMNNEIYGRVLGFREFIRTAEYDRLKMLSNEDPAYYFNILPYAFIFGMSTKWADKFAEFPIPQPEWYRSDAPFDPMFGHWMFVNTGSGLNSAANGYYRAVGSGMLSGALDSGSGGFGGGGFSGGGFGGGGGGSW